MTDLTSAVTLIVPTVHHRAELFARTLRYFRHVGWRGPIVVSDHSAPAHLSIVRGLVGDFGDLNLILRTDSPEAHFLTRLAQCAQAARTAYVHLHADDDFLVLSTLARLHAIMASDPGCAAAMGLNIHIQFGKRWNAMLSKRSAQDPRAFNRLLSQLENFSSVLYALRRRAEFIDSLSYAESRCPDVQFWQYLETCEAALAGTVSVIDDLHYVRQVHPQKWSRQLVEARSPDHFPSLILSPNFHPRLAAFRKALTDSCARRDVAVDPRALDDGLVHLLYRGFGVMGLPAQHSAEAPSCTPEQITARLQDPNDPATEELNRICQFAETS